MRMEKYAFLFSTLLAKIDLTNWYVSSGLSHFLSVSLCDVHSYQESAEERWRPILSVESIIISVISMLSNPNDESPANLDAAVSQFFY